jgi:prephenate dehydrogenase
MTLQITIVGLNQVGASIGLALKEHKDLVKRTGHDREVATARQAEKLDAVDNISLNLPSAVRQADLVIVTEPFDQLLETIQTIAQDLREGAVLMDTAPVKVGLAEQVAKVLPAGRYYVSLLPTINPAYLDETGSGIENAHADLFKGSVIGISQSSGANTDAIKLATDLVGLLGATPLFADAVELDGLTAAARQLPQLLAAALVRTATLQPGWREARKITGTAFGHGSRPVLDLDETKLLGQAAIMNRENVLRLIDAAQVELSSLRTAIEEADQAGLQALLAGARTDRETWIGQRQSADWQSEGLPQNQSPTPREMLGRLIGFGRRPDKPN